MNEINFEIPNYDRAIAGFARKIQDGLIALNPVLGNIRSRLTEHGGPTRNIAGTTPLDHDLMTFQHTFVMHRDMIRDTDLDGYVSLIYEMAREFEKAMELELFRVLSSTIEAAGNVVSSNGEPFTHSLFNQVLEKLEIDFDQDGNALMPTLLVNPETFKQIKDIEPTEGELAERNAIMERKKEEFHAKKRTRSLS